MSGRRSCSKDFLSALRACFRGVLTLQFGRLIRILLPYCPTQWWLRNRLSHLILRASAYSPSDVGRGDNRDIPRHRERCQDRPSTTPPDARSARRLDEWEVGPKKMRVPLLRANTLLRSSLN